VRAEWRIGDRPVYVLSAWARIGSHITIEQSDARASLGLRDRSFSTPDEARERLGTILNVVDTNRDGCGEVMLMQQGGDGRAVELFEYSRSADAPRRVVARLDDSC
jgi:hypothetical protein